ncbi:MAG: hypothetical protein CL678_01680 [Bdellovibrionaceae bacterium]|nr:hypothetical protein [Pseudobdellovibrionaceae bacterium]|tara:strand:+ start:5952 stop:7160 length:1209 start_codon:yes stop_codon:yes gene_type:complete
MFQLGLENLLTNKDLLNRLRGKRVGLVAHPASIDQELNHSIDLLMNHSDIQLTCGFGPQHGIRGDVQDNMVETENEIHPEYKIPLFSLYGEVRRPTHEMLEHADVFLFDLQDVGCRIYTFVATLRYLMEEAASLGKEVWILDRPNPVGRGVEGSLLEKEWMSFVGQAFIPMQHGLTLGELAVFFKESLNLDLTLEVVPMKNYFPSKEPWPKDLAWVNPSPNLPTFTSTRAYTGTVILEGTHLSEGRGTTRVLEVLGAPNLQIQKILDRMKEIEKNWYEGVRVRPCFFIPMFHKFKDQLCNGVQIHSEDRYCVPSHYRPFRWVALFLKALKETHPSFEIWRSFHYEYEKDRLAIDLLTGSDFLRKWVDDPHSTPEMLESKWSKDEQQWILDRDPYLIYEREKR